MSRGRIQGFKKERLDQILAVRGLSQLQLASLVGVSPGTVSKWRAGNQIPEKEALARLATVVNVSEEWFTRPVQALLEQPLFRSNAQALVTARGMLKARTEWVQDIGYALQEFLDFPDLNLPVRDFRNPLEISTEDIEEAAIECRKYWKLGRVAIQDLALAAESAGIILVREQTGVTQIESLSAWSTVLNRPIIYLSADKGNAYRSRFDLAHEIGHLILHSHVIDTENRERHKLLEKQAHDFAGALLLPAETFAREVKLPVTLDDLLLLKKRWGVSVAAMVMRLKAMHMIDEEETSRLYRRRSARWGVKFEPGDDDRVPEQPRLLRRSVELLVKENILPLESITDYFGISARDVEMLAGLREGYLDGRNNVIELSRLRGKLNANLVNEEIKDNNIIPFKIR